MKVVADNSGCCAIKHIRDFYFLSGPDSFISVVASRGHSQDSETSEPDAYIPWEETKGDNSKNAGEHFRDLVTQIKERRPAGMITVNLVEEYNEDEDEVDIDSVNAWEPLLTELGFTSVRFRNSNSGNFIHHYTCIYDEEN